MTRASKDAIEGVLERLRLPTSPDRKDPQIDPVLADIVQTVQYLEQLQKIQGAIRNKRDGRIYGVNWMRSQIRRSLVERVGPDHQKVHTFDWQVKSRGKELSFVADQIIGRLDDLYQRHFSSYRKRSPFIIQFMGLLGWPEDTITRYRITKALKRNALRRQGNKPT